MADTPIPNTVRTTKTGVTVQKNDAPAVVVKTSDVRVVRVGGPAGASGSATFEGLDDTSVAGAILDDLVQFDGSFWINVTIDDVVDASSHAADADIHFEEGDIDHDNIQNNGTNDHAAIDAHIGNATIHFTLEDVDDQVAGLLQDTPGLTWSYDDSANTLTPVLNPHVARYEKLSTSMYVESDFTDPPEYKQTYGFIVILSGAGASVLNPAATFFPDHPGIWQITTGITSTGRAFILSAVQNTLVFGTGVTRVGTWLRTPSNLSDGTDRYLIRSGFSSVHAGGAFDHAVTFEYIDNENGGRWQAITHDGTETSTDTGITVTADTWYKLEIEVNAAGTSVEFFIDGVSVATNTTNIPSGTGFDVFYSTHIFKQLGTAGRGIMVDAAYIYQEVTR